MNSNDTGRNPRRRNFAYPDPSAEAYATTPPFPHAVVHGAWEPALLADCKRDIGEFTAWDGEKNFYGSRKKRTCANIEMLPPSVVEVIDETAAPAFLRWLEQLTGEPSLIPDPYLEGGGIHQIDQGGFLKVHADFNWNQRLSLYRRVNVLLYLNPTWESEWRGELELWRTDMSACAKAVAPVVNTMVVFTTDDQSFHGHPHPLACPADIRRDSIALYYYSALRPANHYAQKRNSTDYRPIEGEEFSKKKRSLLSRIARKFQ